MQSRMKGFTLVELLAVIVILAIITLIATPMILGVIENVKKGAAKSSFLSYIDSIELYQAMSKLSNDEFLVEGKYYVDKVSIINEKEYSKINDLVTMKGKKPSSGYVNIKNDGMVGSASLCINNYLVEYVGGNINISKNECDDIESMIDFVVDSFEYESSKELTIKYPEGPYLYYFKVDDGVVSLDNENIEVGREIQVQSNIVKLKLDDNSTITAWMKKGNEKRALKTYQEKKIDNVEIGVPTISMIGNAVVTSSGISILGELNVNYEEQEGTSAYYSLDEGHTWIKYEKIQSMHALNIQVKLVRDKSKREGPIVNYIAQTQDPYISSDVLDNDENTIIKVLNTTITKYIDVDRGAWNKEIVFTYSNDNGDEYDHMVISFLSSDGSLISSVGKIYPTVRKQKTSKELNIPVNTAKIKIDMVGYNSARTFYLHEVKFTSKPYFNELEKNPQYPLLSIKGIKSQSTAKISIDYGDGAKEKLYKIDNGEWKNYDGTISLLGNQVVYAKGVSKYGKTILETSYTPNYNNDALESFVFDGNMDTYIKAFNTSLNRYIEVDQSIWNREITFTYSNDYGDEYDHMIVSFLSSDGNLISNSEKIYPTVRNQKTEKSLIIPSGTKKIKIYMIGCNHVRTFYLYDIGLTTKAYFNELEVKSVYPLLTLNGINNRSTSKVNIEYIGNVAKKLYKIDNGEWKNYDDGTISLSGNHVVYAKGEIANGDAISEVSYAPHYNIDVLDELAFDNDLNTYIRVLDSSVNKYIEVDQSVWGKNLKFTYSNNYGDNYDYMQVSFISSSGSLISSSGIIYPTVRNQKTEKTLTIPSGTKKIGIYMIGYNSARSFYLYDVRLT